MNYRIAEIFKDTSMGTSGTEIIPIDIRDPMSQIIIKQRSTGTLVSPTAHFAAVLPNIEIVDGSDVLYSLAAYEADAFDFYHRKVVPNNVNNYLSGVQGIRSYFLNFGRHLYDPVLALDPTKFRNPQLKITYDRDAGGCASSALELHIVAHIFDEKKITPTGFLMHKEIKKYTIAQGTWERTPMPTDYPWRMLLMSSRYPGKAPFSQFRDIKLTEDVDKRVPFSFSTSALMDWMSTYIPLYHEGLYAAGSTGGDTYFITPSVEANFGGTQEENVAGYVSADYGMGGTIEITCSVSANFLGTVLGNAPHGSVVVPFGIQDDIADWYDVKNIGKLLLLMKGHASAYEGDCQICLQQYRPYAV